MFLDDILAEAQARLQKKKLPKTQKKAPAAKTQKKKPAAKTKKNLGFSSLPVEQGLEKHASLLGSIHVPVGTKPRYRRLLEMTAAMGGTSPQRLGDPAARWLERFAKRHPTLLVAPTGKVKRYVWIGPWQDLSFSTIAAALTAAGSSNRRGSGAVGTLDNLMEQVVGNPLKEQLRRCVLAVHDKLIAEGVAQDEALSRAYAICTAQLQRGGYLKAGSNRPTPKGIAAALKKLGDPQAQRKHRKYEGVLQSARNYRASRGLISLDDLFEKAGAANRYLSIPAGSSNVDLSNRLQPLREAMDEIFRCDTAYGTCHPDAPSAGHCMLASMVVQDLFGGKIVGGIVKQIPHYWNRLDKTDVDVTGDQFGFPGVRVKKGPLHKGSVFQRKPQETLKQPYNSEVTRLHKRFVKRLIPILNQMGESDWVAQLNGRSMAVA
jgi:hypothetical protein